jgi:hypothetical protein
MKSLASADVLSETRERLLRLRGEDTALWGQMTVAQMLRHLGLSYEMALGEREAAPMNGLPPGMMRWIALRSGVRWPKNVGSPTELVDTSDSSFSEWLARTLGKMEAVSKGTHYSSRHPMFGSMTVKDWLRYCYLHADHHLRQFGR